MIELYLNCPYCHTRIYQAFSEDTEYPCPRCDRIYHLSVELRPIFPIVLPKVEAPCREKNVKK